MSKYNPQGREKEQKESQNNTEYYHLDIPPKPLTIEKIRLSTSTKTKNPTKVRRSNCPLGQIKSTIFCIKYLLSKNAPNKSKQ